MLRALLVSCLLLIGATPAFASAPDVNGTISLDQTNPVRGSTVTFTVTFSKPVQNPDISVTCRQGTTVVFDRTIGIDESVTLTWASGPATCTANLHYQKQSRGGWTQIILADSISFAVGG